MDVSNPDGEIIDSDLLQNSINMSLSHAFDLVSTWMKPPKSAGSIEEIKRIAEDKAFEEFGRRPPRLGIGAPVATGGPSARETSNLLRKLSSKKRLHEADSKSSNGMISGSNHKKAQHSSDDEDSRAKAISSKKKAKTTNGIINAFPEPKNKRLKVEVDQASKAISRPQPLNESPFHSEPIDGAESSQPFSPSSLLPHSMSPTPSESKSVSTTSTAVPLTFNLTEQSNTHQLRPSSTHNTTSMNETPRSTPVATQSQSSRTSSPISSTFPNINGVSRMSSAKELNLPLLNLVPIPDFPNPKEGVETADGLEGERKKKKKKKRRKNKTQGNSNGDATEEGKNGPISRSEI